MRQGRHSKRSILSADAPASGRDKHDRVAPRHAADALDLASDWHQIWHQIWHQT